MAKKQKTKELIQVTMDRYFTLDGYTEPPTKHKAEPRRIPKPSTEAPSKIEQDVAE